MGRYCGAVWRRQKVTANRTQLHPASNRCLACGPLVLNCVDMAARLRAALLDTNSEQAQRAAAQVRSGTRSVRLEHAVGWKTAARRADLGGGKACTAFCQEPGFRV